MSPGPGADSAPAPLTTQKISTFASFRIRNYRIHFLGSAISNIGTWMQRIAQDWLVHELTGSAAAVGVTSALQFLPMLLFGLWGGVLADRLNKRKLLLGTQAAMGLCGLTLAALTFTGVVNVWHVYAVAFVVGLITVVDNPARQTFVSDMVGPALLRNAVSLNSANFQSARLIGPAVAGVLISAVGGGWAFLYNGLSFLAPLTGLLMMRTSELHPAARAARGKGQLREGLRYVGSRPELLWLIVLVGFVGMFGYNFPIWLVAFTDTVFHSDAGTFGLLNSLMAAGSVAGALLSARRGSRRTRFTIGAAAVFGLALMIVSFAPAFWLFAALLPAVGLITMTFQVTANSTIQIGSDPAMRGRVVALYMMVFVGGTPIGGPVMGWLTDAVGARLGMATGGAICLIAAVSLALLLARIGGLRLEIRLRRGQRGVFLVPRDREEMTATA